MSNFLEGNEYKSPREKFLGLSLKSSRKSYFPQLKEHLESSKENERRLRLLIDSMPARISYVNSEERYVIANVEHEKVFGLKSNQIIGKHIETILGSENYQKVKQYIHEALTGTKVCYETSFIRKNGDMKWLEVNYVPDINAKGEVLGFYDLTLDLTEKKEAEEALKKSEDLFKLITNHSSALVSIHDANGNYIYASQSHERLGYTPEDLIGKSGFAMMVEEDIESLLLEFEQARQTNISKAFFSYRLKDKKGKIHFYRGAFDAVINPEGSLEKLVCVGEDITELTKAQAEKVKALTFAAENRQLALVGQIAGKMAHDFNNVLGVIMGNTELSLLDCKDVEIKKTLELILEQTMRGKNLTKNLVAFAKDQEIKQEFFKISEKIDLVLNLLKKDLEDIEVIREDSQGVPNLLADPGMIEHAFVNLLQNSIHALSKIDSPRITLRTYSLDNNICFEIEDNGCGIPRDHVGNIYDPSFTLKGIKDVTGAYKSSIKGSGYGMANVKKYVEQHNGSISFDSEPGMGTKFTIRIPIIKKELTREEKVKVKEENVIYEKDVLLVEDERAISDVQYRLLTQEPCYHRVDIASNGEIAIDLFDRNEYDFVSLDYILPGTINGTDVYKHIRESNPTIPILFISGNIEFLESIRELKQKDTNIDHLSKPCRNIDYVNSINKLLKSILE
jgi:PAS domain S-box-containing protein